MKFITIFEIKIFDALLTHRKTLRNKSLVNLSVINHRQDFTISQSYYGETSQKESFWSHNYECSEFGSLSCSTMAILC